MPRKKTAPAPPAATPAPPPAPAAGIAARKASKSASSTSQLFAGKVPKDRNASMTSERIAGDLDAFHKAGGRIEVLGTTRSLLRIGVEDAPAQTTDAKPPPPPDKRKR